MKKRRPESWNRIKYELSFYQKNLPERWRLLTSKPLGRWRFSSSAHQISWVLVLQLVLNLRRASFQCRISVHTFQLYFRNAWVDKIHRTECYLVSSHLAAKAVVPSTQLLNICSWSRWNGNLSLFTLGPKKNHLSHLFHSTLPDFICVSFNKAPTIEDLPLPLFPTITVRTPVGTEIFN